MLKTHFNWPYLSATSASFSKTDEFSDPKNISKIFFILRIYMTVKRCQKARKRWCVPKNLQHTFSENWVAQRDTWTTEWLLRPFQTDLTDPNTKVSWFQQCFRLHYWIPEIEVSLSFLAVYIIKSMLCCRDDFNFPNCFSWIFKSIIGSCGTVMIHLSWTGPL